LPKPSATTRPASHPTGVGYGFGALAPAFFAAISFFSRSLRWAGCAPARFAKRCTGEDIALLAAVDAAHEDLSGPAARRIVQREYQVFGHVEFARLAGISVFQIYNLRNSAAYRSRRVRVQHTQARPARAGQVTSAWIRCTKATTTASPACYLNAVDTVTQCRKYT